MSEVKSLDGVTEYANRLIQSAVVEEVSVTTPYPQVWKWHSPLPKPLREIFQKMDEMTVNNLKAFAAALPPEALIPNKLVFATNFEVDFFFYAKFFEVDAYIKKECHAIEVATKDRLRVRKHVKAHKLPHVDFPIITLPVAHFKDKIATLYKT